MWKLNWFKNWDFHDCFTFDILFERPCTYVTLCWLTHYYGIWTFLGFYCYWSEGRNLLWDRPPNPFHWTLKAARKQLMAMLIGCFEWITEAVSYKSYWINMQKNVTGHQVKLTLWPKFSEFQMEHMYVDVFYFMTSMLILMLMMIAPVVGNRRGGNGLLDLNVCGMSRLGGAERIWGMGEWPIWALCLSLCESLWAWMERKSWNGEDEAHLILGMTMRMRHMCEQCLCCAYMRLHAHVKTWRMANWPSLVDT